MGKDFDRRPGCNGHLNVKHNDPGGKESSEADSICHGTKHTADVQMYWVDGGEMDGCA